MISGIDLNATIDYTLKDDIENPTVFKLGILPSYILGRLSESMAGEQSNIQSAYQLLQLSIKGWSNFNIEYKTSEEEMFGRKMQVIPISILEQISLNVITELSVKCLEINKLTVEERKN
jgi:hypothetical protein